MRSTLLFVCLCLLALSLDSVHSYKRGEKGKYKDKNDEGFKAPAPSEITVEVLHRPEQCERKSSSGDTIEGKLKSNGQVFDASKPRGQPFSFKIGTGQVIPGWDRGLLGMCVGEIRRLTIPPEFAYGDRGVPPVIPGGSTLVFETELLAIN